MGSHNQPRLLWADGLAVTWRKRCEDDQFAETKPKRPIWPTKTKCICVGGCAGTLIQDEYVRPASSRVGRCSRWWINHNVYFCCRFKHTHIVFFFLINRIGRVHILSWRFVFMNIQIRIGVFPRGNGISIFIHMYIVNFICFLLFCLSLINIFSILL